MMPWDPSHVEENGGTNNHIGVLSEDALRVVQETYRAVFAELRGNIVHGGYALFSTDGSGEDLVCAVNLARVVQVFPAYSERVLPQRKGAIALSWVAQAEARPDRISTKDLQDVIDGINNALNADRFDLLDEVLRELNTLTMSVEAIIAFLRVPFMGRHRLKEWRAFRERAAAEFSRRGLDADRLLRGLR